MVAQRQRGTSNAARKKAEPNLVPLTAHRTGGTLEARPWMKRWLDSFLHE
ncbi:MAG TPA: hypothetical protein VNZ52_16435 [Candidatus Thermoplasmatota archaeon]|nr:hypothetical protein [Candidatus Thermoplasmatota archaeon]